MATVTYHAATEPEIAEARERVDRVLDLIESTNGRIFGVTFIKRDGTERHMVARIGVTKGVKGVGMSYDPHKYALQPVFDMQKRAYRMVDLDTVKSFRFRGEVVFE